MMKEKEIERASHKVLAGGETVPARGVAVGNQKPVVRKGNREDLASTKRRGASKREPMRQRGKRKRNWPKGPGGRESNPLKKLENQGREKTGIRPKRGRQPVSNCEPGVEKKEASPRKGTNAAVISWGKKKD